MWVLILTQYNGIKNEERKGGDFRQKIVRYRVKMANPNDVQVRERKKQETPRQEEPKKSNKALIVVLIVLILALVGVIAWLLLSQKSSPEPEGKANTT